MAGRLDFIILGATGFTGIHCIPYIYKLAKENGRNLTWGISGRSEEKLKEALAKMGNTIEADLSSIPIILSDIKDYNSVLKVAQKAKVLINCCGPYRFLGEPVVKACIEAGTNYVDVSGEPQFIESVQLKYHEAAKERGIYIVSACGFDSIPCDLGLVYFQNKFEGTLNSVVTYIEFWQEGDKTPGPAANYGTWESLVYGLAHAGELSFIRKQLSTKKLPSFKPKLEAKTSPHRPQMVEGWSLPFPGADRSIMRRTQRYMYEHENKRPIQVDTQFILKSIFDVVFLMVTQFLLSVLVKYSFGVKILLNYPHIFTAGMFRKDQNPSEEIISKSLFQITFYGEGWKEKLSDKNDQFSNPPNKIIVARVKGRNPGYGTTCACLVGSAIMIATEKDKLPANGGVYTPGIAFEKTSLVDLLHKNDLHFEIISQND